jgi:hypothetical protein
MACERLAPSRRSMSQVYPNVPRPSNSSPVGVAGRAVGGSLLAECWGGASRAYRTSTGGAATSGVTGWFWRHVRWSALLRLVAARSHRSRGVKPESFYSLDGIRSRRGALGRSSRSVSSEARQRRRLAPTVDDGIRVSELEVETAKRRLEALIDNVSLAEQAWCLTGGVHQRAEQRALRQPLA